MPRKNANANRNGNTRRSGFGPVRSNLDAFWNWANAAENAKVYASPDAYDYWLAKTRVAFQNRNKGLSRQDMAKL